MVEWFENRGYEVVLMKELMDIFFGKFIRWFVFMGGKEGIIDGVKISYEVEVFFFVVDRVEYVDKLIKFFFEVGKVVIFDCYFYLFFVY